MPSCIYKALKSCNFLAWIRVSMAGVSEEAARNEKDTSDTCYDCFGQVQEGNDGCTEACNDSNDKSKWCLSADRLFRPVPAPVLFMRRNQGATHFGIFGQRCCKNTNTTRLTNGVMLELLRIRRCTERITKWQVAKSLGPWHWFLCASLHHILAPAVRLQCCQPSWTVRCR